MTRLRQVMAGGALTLGGWCSIPSAFSAELMGRCGFDWLCLDMQHGLIGLDCLPSMLQAVEATATPTFVRVAWNSPDYLMKALDAGAHGVIVPMIDTADDARRAVDAVRYPPLGQRSWGPLRARFGLAEYSPQAANADVVLAVMIETPSAMSAMDDILAVDGVDAAFVGPADLALSHGFTPSLRPQPGSEHERLIEQVGEACIRHGVAGGTLVAAPQDAARWAAAGFGLISIAGDATLLQAAADCVRIARRDADARKDTSSYYL
jgi:4-hydroxy-2-oxoheptanedioate aldolase